MSWSWSEGTTCSCLRGRRHRTAGIRGRPGWPATWACSQPSSHSARLKPGYGRFTGGTLDIDSIFVCDDFFFFLAKGFVHVNSFAAGHLHRLKKKSQHKSKIDSNKPFQNKRTWLCFSCLQAIESNNYAKLGYLTLKLWSSHWIHHRFTQYA
jgi:hypothetical protein